jgi:thiol-disulfide isomerase/thioredoxin
MRPITTVKLLAIFLISMNFANASPAAPQNGSDYHSIESSAAIKNDNKTTVVEFFAYFCPH